MVVLGAGGALLLTTATTLIGVQGRHSTPPALGGAYTAAMTAVAAAVLLARPLAHEGSKPPTSRRTKVDRTAGQRFRRATRNTPRPADDPSPGTRTARGMSVRNLGSGRTW